VNGLQHGGKLGGGPINKYPVSARLRSEKAQFKGRKGRSSAYNVSARIPSKDRFDDRPISLGAGGAMEDTMARTFDFGGRKAEAHARKGTLDFGPL
jgi:hypothetical protein